MSNTFKELGTLYKEGDLLSKLIFILSGIYLTTSLTSMVLSLFDSSVLLRFIFALPANIAEAVSMPWSLVTYMFYHEQFIHFIFNILMLYWMGKLFMLSYQPRDLVNLFIFGGLVGGLFFILALNLFPSLSAYTNYTTLDGSSAAIMAVLVAAAIANPEMPVKLVLLGEIRLKWIAMAFVALSVLVDYKENAGGCFAHLGGAVAGYLFGYHMRKGTNITQWIGRIIDFLSNLVDKLANLLKGNKSPKFKVVYNNTHGKAADESYNMRKKAQNEAIDAILDKIKESGYSSLTDEERATLFNASKK
ncbi:MAG: rhomboid family intramembrane serine protease [Paludibacteraceae bacterium]|jgi:membrane associated rhomboid family serine protease|nr:rhomboid family intramembrane serine protease [Paludibacteraceae bacterium]MBR6103557.1 rhomboid family intramembrane serine protease [Paludibacteraceae bacterium]